MKPDGEDPVPSTIHAILRNQQNTAVAQDTARLIQKRLVVRRMVKYVQKEHDIITSGSYRHHPAIENLKWYIGLIDIDDIQAKYLTALSVAEQWAQVTAPGAYVQTLWTLGEFVIAAYEN